MQSGLIGKLFYCQPNGNYQKTKSKFLLYRESYMSAHVLLNLLNEMEKRDKMRGLPNVRFYLPHDIKIT